MVEEDFPHLPDETKVRGVASTSLPCEGGERSGSRVQVLC